MPEAFGNKIVKAHFICFLWVDINVDDCVRFISIADSWIESKLYGDTLCDIGKHCIVIQTNM